MFLHERFAIFVGLGPIKLEEAVVARRFCLGTSTTAKNEYASGQRISEESRSMTMTTYGFKPSGLRGFCLGSVGSYGNFAGGGGDQRAVT